MTYVYHFELKENVPKILEQGLNVNSKNNKLNSKLRDKAIYALLNPEHDKMGYIKEKAYTCLKIKVNPRECFVANMDIISAAFVNFIGSGEQNKKLSLVQELVSHYDNSAVFIDEYVDGMFRAPEVIIPYNVSPEDISIYSIPTSYKDVCFNTKLYNELCLKKMQSLSNHHNEEKNALITELILLGVIKKIATHDDSNRLLTTYKIVENNEFFTIELCAKIA